MPDIIRPQKKIVREIEPESPSPNKVSAIVPITIILAGIIVAGSVLFLDKKVEVPDESTPALLSETENKTADPRPISKDDHILGNPNAKVFIIEYSDLECEYCKNLHATLHEIIDEFGKTGEVAWVYRQFPITQVHSQAMTESEASECVAKLGGNSAFWKYIDRIFEVTTSGNSLDLGKLPEIAKEVGVDEAAFNNCLVSGEMRQRIQVDSDDALASGASGTPFIHIIGPGSKTSFNGLKSYLALKIIINKALNK